MDDLEQLKRWKREATEVLDQWEGCAKDLMSWGIEPNLGESRAEFVRRWIRSTLMELEIEF